MKGVGGPLLCIGDLLSDVGEGDSQEIPTPNSPSSPPPPSPPPRSCGDFQPSHLAQLFQENYDELNKALVGTDHSWTSLTLKLCTALDTSKKLIDSTNSKVMELSHKVAELDHVIQNGDSVIADVRSIHSSLSQRLNNA